MATATTTILENGERNLVVLVNVSGAGALGPTLLIDRSAFAPTDGTKTRVDKIEGQLNGFTGQLSFDATADLPFAQLDDDYFHYDWWSAGGVSSNKAGAGANGDILISVTDPGATGQGTFTIWMRKH